MNEPSTSGLALSAAAAPPADGPRFARTLGHLATVRQAVEGDWGQRERPAVDAAAAAAFRLGRALPMTAADATYELVPQIDSAKTFVGRNGTYYDETWRWMDWRGRRWSWHWPALLSLGGWFAYRRLSWQADACLAGLLLLLALAVNGVWLRVLAPTALLAALLLGLFANAMYLRRFRDAVAASAASTGLAYHERLRHLAAAGGTDRAAVGRYYASLLALGVSLLAMTYWLRGQLALAL